MQTQTDSKKHIYIDVATCRVTYIPAKDRTESQNWADSDVIRIQSYKGEQDRSLHMGAEIPVASPAVFGELVAAICQVYAEGR